MQLPSRVDHLESVHHASVELLRAREARLSFWARYRRKRFRDKAIIAALKAGKPLRFAPIAAGLTLRDVAEAAGLPTEDVSKIAKRVWT